MYKSKLDKNLLFVAKTRNYDIFVAKIYDYVLINSFGGFPGIIDSLTSYASLVTSGIPNSFQFYPKKTRHFLQKVEN